MGTCRDLTASTYGKSYGEEKVQTTKPIVWVAAKVVVGKKICRANAHAGSSPAVRTNYQYCGNDDGKHD